jgi:serine/threonine-protein kinase
MALAAGKRLGPYEVIAAIGAGGMGEVYKARDTRLDRTVAVKVLPAEVAADPEFRERFHREARSISALDHPHICALYDVGEHEGTAYLVMQHLEGETLAARLERGALPVDQAVTCAIQIAAALDQAHRHGIVHRDLKPGNVMLTKTGAKLLDFGLAKAAPAAVSGTAATALATSPRPGGSPALTAQGTIVGTFQYMAPEQLEGRQTDARTDIFAFGAMLHEMITGRRAFDGPTQAGVIAAILERQPPSISTLRPEVPAALDHVVRRAVAKAPDDRWQTACDLGGELQWVAGQIGLVSAAAPPPRVSSRLLPALAGVVAGALVTLGAVMWLTPADSPTVTLRAMIPLPASAIYGIWAPSIAISPDARRLVYTAEHNGVPMFWLRSLDSFDAEPIRGTELARAPFFSPDGEQLGFFVDGKLKRVVLRGSLPVAICDAPDVRGASWIGDTIVLAPSVDGGLVRVPAEGGTPQPVTTLDASTQERTHRFPHVLPGGRAVVFMIGTTQIPSYADARIAVQSLDGGPPKVLVEGGAAPMYAQGHLFYSRGTTLMAAPFDISRLELTGSAFVVADGVGFRSSFGVSEYGVASDGTLIYLPGGETQPAARLLLFDRTGRSTVLDDAPRFHLEVMTSPDGQQLLLWDQQANDSLWIRDLRRGTASRVTFAGNIFGGSWMPDGQRVIYSLSDRMAWAPVDASGTAEEIYRDPFFVSVPLASADNNSVYFTTPRPETGNDIWRLSLSNRRAEPWLASRFNEFGGPPSPDGSLIAYTSDETGRLEVFVRPSAGGTRVQVSGNGGVSPIWSRDGRQLFFVANSTLHAVSIRREPTLDVGTPQALFRVPPPQRFALFVPRSYDALPDGRFVFIEDAPMSRPAEVRLIQAAIR